MTDVLQDTGKKPVKTPLSHLKFDESAPLLEVEDLQVEFHTRDGIAHAVNEQKHWYDWGHPVMWLVGRYSAGNTEPPRGRDLTRASFDIPARRP